MATNRLKFAEGQTGPGVLLIAGNVSPNITGSGPNNHIENSEITHPKTKMSHERWWLEDYNPFKMVTF